MSPSSLCGSVPIRTAARPPAIIIINLGVWETREQLWDFLYRSPHLDMLLRRREWFAPFEAAYLVLWWVPAGHIPSLDEAIEWLRRLQADGPGPQAFTFRQPFDAPTLRHLHSDDGSPPIR